VGYREERLRERGRGTEIQRHTDRERHRETQRDTEKERAARPVSQDMEKRA
jgi:hypothetical protein